MVINQNYFRKIGSYLLKPFVNKNHTELRPTFLFSTQIYFPRTFTKGSNKNRPFTLSPDPFSKLYHLFKKVRTKNSNLYLQKFILKDLRASKRIYKCLVIQWKIFQQAKSKFPLHLTPQALKYKKKKLKYEIRWEEVKLKQEIYQFQ